MELRFHKFKTTPPVKIPIISFKGKKKGKVCFISGGIHGDELNGMMLVKRFIEDFEKRGLEKNMIGELIVMPILNVSGFVNGQRRAKPDGLDLNRAFPGKKSGTFSQQFAKELFSKFISRADFAIDCHDAGTHSALVPHTRVGDEGTEKLGKIFGTEIIIKREGKKGMMALEAFKKFGIPLITVEIGGAKHIYEDQLRDSIKGIKNLMRTYGMLSGKPEKTRGQKVLTDRYGVKSQATGIIELNLELGKRVHKGDVVGKIYHPHLFREHTLVAPLCGMIFSIHDHQIVKKGRVMYSILEMKECHGKPCSEKDFGELQDESLQHVVM